MIIYCESNLQMQNRNICWHKCYNRIVFIDKTIFPPPVSIAFIVIVLSLLRIHGGPQNFGTKAQLLLLLINYDYKFVYEHPLFYLNFSCFI